MAPPYGVDTQTSHLDRIPWPAFLAWNGDAGPVFAGRNFLGGDFIWASPEATTALAAPKPDDVAQLETTTDYVAPFQAKSSSRQQVTGDMGRLYGQIDGTALCARLAATINTKELTPGDTDVVYVYLEVDPSAAFSVDYWAGWSDAVYHAIVRTKDAGGTTTTFFPFMPCIRCAFTLSGGKLQIDPHVLATIKAAPTQHKELHVSCWGFWADAADLFPAMQKTGTGVDWTVFAPTPVTVWLWRFSTKLLNADGQPMNQSVMNLAVDAANVAGTPAHSATDYMLKTGKWQPTMSVVNWGLSFGYTLTSANITGLAAAKVPKVALTASCGNKVNIAAGQMQVLGLYMRETAGITAFTPDVVGMVRGTALRLFTGYEVSTGGTSAAYYDPAAHHGTRDGNTAFAWAAEHLFQPPHSTIYFAYDWAPDVATPAEMSADDMARVTTFFTDIHDAYTAYLATHPNRPYRIGFYGSALVLRILYDQAFVSGFWQSSAPCRAAHLPPNWPWAHNTRWQAVGSAALDPKLAGIAGEDLDYDWGDGGTWAPTDPLNLELTQIEVNATPALTKNAQTVFGNLITPAQP